MYINHCLRSITIQELYDAGVDKRDERLSVAKGAEPLFGPIGQQVPVTGESGATSSLRQVTHIQRTKKKMQAFAPVFKTIPLVRFYVFAQ